MDDAVAAPVIGSCDSGVSNHETSTDIQELEGSSLYSIILITAFNVGSGYQDGKDVILQDGLQLLLVGGILEKCKGRIVQLSKL